MRAAVTVSPHRTEVREVPDLDESKIPPGHALVEVQTVGLCGTDRHIWEGEYPSGSLPIVQGHEVAGTLLDLAPGTDCAIPVGAQVVLDPTTNCGRCYACRIGRANACRQMSVMGVHGAGALCDRIAVPAQRVHAAPRVGADVAALAEPASISLQSVARSGARGGEHVVVLGCGPIGLLATMALLELGARVAVVDRQPDRLPRATELGAERALTAVDAPAREDAGSSVEDELRAWADGEGPSIVVEATGSPSALGSALRMVAHAGCVVAVGISGSTAALPMITLPYKELDLRGSRNSHGLLPQAVDLVTRHEDAVRRLVTHRFPLEALDEAYAAMARPSSGVCKAVVELRRHG